MLLNQGELGERFGATSHEVGRWLKEIGLRAPDGRPSHDARVGGYVTSGPLCNGHASYRWDEAKTTQALEAAGHRRKTVVSTGRIVGPFAVQQVGVSKYEVLNGDGTTSIQITGEWNAGVLTRVLNLAYKYGKFGGGQSGS